MRMAQSELNTLIITIKNRNDFLRMRHGKKWVAKTMIVQTVPNNDDTIRVGYTITKKIFKSAVKRNRVKRRLKALTNDVMGTCAQTGHDFVLIGRQDTLTASYDTLMKDLKWCLKRLELLAQ